MPKIVYSQGTTILEAELPTMSDQLFYTPEGLSGVKAEYYKGLIWKKILFLYEQKNLLT